MALDFHVKSSRILLRESDTANDLAIEVSEREGRWDGYGNHCRSSSSSLLE